MLYIASSFTIGMLDREDCELMVKPLTIEEAAQVLDSHDQVVTSIPHANIANIVGKELGMEVIPSKERFTLLRGEEIIVTQPEGDFGFPTITYWLIRRA
jgi:hypothetical protein